MKASELRIGNWIIGGDETAIKGNFQVDGWHINAMVEFEKTAKRFVDWQSIAITEEWLIKFGFEKASIGNIKFVKGLYAIHENYHLGNMTGYNLCIKGVDWYNVASVKFVHQLQNLYFALTGEELCA